MVDASFNSTALDSLGQEVTPEMAEKVRAILALQPDGELLSEILGLSPYEAWDEGVDATARGRRWRKVIREPIA